MKILAVKLRAIGDTVIWTAALAALKKSYPDAEIHIMTYATNAAVLANHGSVTQLHLLRDKSKKELMRRLWRQRPMKFDLMLGFHATTSLCRWAWLAGAKKKALHHHSWRRSPWGSLKVPHAGQLENAILRDHRVLEAIGITEAPEPTGIVLTPGEQAWAEVEVFQRIEAFGGKPAKQRMIFLPGASHELRRYPKDLWLALVEKTKAEGKYQPVVICDPQLAAEWDLVSECKRIKVPLFDKPKLREFIALISRGHKAMANDSGPGHIAVAVGVKTTFLFGPGCAGDWHCYDSQVHPLIRVDVDCRLEGPREQELYQYCIVESCSHRKCMRTLPVEL
jgi:ADP-heptose:LPS heptosyltransferase